MAPLVPPPQRPRFNPLDISAPIDSAYRVGKALETAQVAAISIGVSHGITALAISQQDPVSTWLSDNSQQLWPVHLAAGIAAVALSVIIRRQGPAWAVWVLLGWGVLEFTRYVPARMYGHAMPAGLGAFIIFCAYQGLRGVRGRQKLAEADLD